MKIQSAKENKTVFPVSRLYGQLFLDIEQYPSVAILKRFDTDKLINLVNPVDLDCKCTNVAEIKRHNNPDTLEMEDSIDLSIAYCQFLWIWCDIAIRSIDRDIAIAEVEKDGKDRDYLIKNNEETLEKSNDELKDILSRYNIEEDVERFREQIERTNESLKDDRFQEKMESQLLLASSLLSEESIPFNPYDLSILNMDEGYGLISNACLIKGVSFILLHEIAHLSLQHDPDHPTMEYELEADNDAFSILYSEAPEHERVTAVVGILCMLFSLVIKDFDKGEDGVHPREDIRLFHILNMISSDNEKYRWLTAYLFKFWARIKKIEDFPDVTFTDTDALVHIKDYFERKYG